MFIKLWSLAFLRIQRTVSFIFLCIDFICFQHKPRDVLLDKTVIIKNVSCNLPVLRRFVIMNLKISLLFRGHGFLRKTDFESFCTKSFVDFKIMKKFADINFCGKSKKPRKRESFWPQKLLLLNQKMIFWKGSAARKT